MPAPASRRSGSALISDNEVTLSGANRPILSNSKSPSGFTGVTARKDQSAFAVTFWTDTPLSERLDFISPTGTLSPWARF